jgi:hypothetical protein
MSRVIRQNSGRLASLLEHCYGDDFGRGRNFSPSVQVPSDSNPMEMLGLPSQEDGGIGDELTASEEALRFGWASWAIHGLFKKAN